MISIFVKELTNFLSSLIAYVVMGVFLTSMGLLMWVFSDTSVLDYGFADMDTLFSLGPYVFIFLVPAITMKSFAEERKMGTLELLLTKPLSDAQIIAGKFLAAVALVVFALIPSLIYYYSVYRLGNPPGNIDTAGVAGSYVGLLLLSMVFCAIGLFASSLTSNQIVSFILAAFISFIFYTGFESLSNLMSSGALVIKQLGILYHYESLSRGLIDSRSVIYFFSVAGLILLITNTVISSRQWINRGWKYSRKWRDLLLLANAAMAMLLINVMAARYFVRIDLTEERRYTIKEQTKHLLQNLDDDVFIEVFLEGDLNPAFGRFKKSIRETLEEFRIYSGNRVQYTFTDPTAASGSKARSEFMSELASKGITPRNIIENKDGQRVEKLVFPGALVSYGGLETGVMLLKGNAMQGAQQVLNQAIEGVEYELANAIDRLAADARPRVALIAGHGELSGASIESFSQALSERYAVDELLIENDQSLRNANLVIIAKPTTAFSEQDKYRLDQYLMRGGRILLLVDRLDGQCLIRFLFCIPLSSELR
jgi:ABC-2 type transport system permease protein